MCGYSPLVKTVSGYYLVIFITDCIILAIHSSTPQISNVIISRCLTTVRMRNIKFEDHNSRIHNWDFQLMNTAVCAKDSLWQDTYEHKKPYTVLSSCICGALRYAAIPYTITLAHSCCCAILLKVIVTDMDCLWPSSGSAVTDHTTGYGQRVSKPSVCTLSDSIIWSQISHWTTCYTNIAMYVTLGAQQTQQH